MSVTDAVVDSAVKAAVTDDSASKPAGTQPATIVAVPETLQGVFDEQEWSALSEKDRTKFEDKGKRLIGDYTKKSQEIAELRRLKEDLESDDPDLLPAVKKTIAEHQARKAGVPIAAANTTTATKSRLEDLLEDANPEQRKLFQGFIEALDERYQGSEKTKKLGELEQTVKELLTTHQGSRRDALAAELKALPASYQPLVKQYQAEILKAGVQRDGVKLSAERLLQIMSSPEEYKQAILGQSPEEAKKHVDKVRQTATAKPSSAVAAVELPETPRSASRDPRFKKGPVDLGSILRESFTHVKRGMGVS